MTVRRRGGRWSVVLLGATLPLGAALLMAGGCPQFPIDGNTNANANANENVNANANDNGSGTVTPGDSGLTGKFVGSARCSLCHNSKHATWVLTLHAEALDGLEAIGQGSNGECLACHSTGFGEAGGFVDRATTNSLAGVGCESCHGPGGDHVGNIEDASKRPSKSISADVCGACHTGEHQPNFDDWLLSRHAEMQESLKEEFVEGTNAATCGVCHSGDVFVAKLNGETVGADFLKDEDPEALNAITCAVCHDPHKRTGNAAVPEDGRDYQLRFAQIKYTEPTNTIAAATDPTRFNLCGQCHHARDRVWTATSREPHPSDQVNVFFGEMPLPTDKPDTIIPSRNSVHLNTAEQCSTCHVFRKAIVEGVAPAVSGHTFEVNFEACADCHGTAEIAETRLANLEAELDDRAGRLKDALDAWGTANGIESKGALSWEYTSEGGPATAGQSKIPDDIKKARFIYYYVVAGGGNGAHNPEYVREGLMIALDLAENAPVRLP